MSPLLLLLLLLPSLSLGQVAIGIARMQSTTPSLPTLTGSLTFIQTASNVTIQGTISGLPPNTVHALHIHQFGDLNGGLSHPERLAHHFNPFNTPHGLVDDPTIPPVPPAISRLATPPIGAVLTTSASQLTASNPIIPGATLPLFQSHPRHVGDIGNIIADGSGTATINVARDLMQLTLGDASIVGRGVALHLLEDRGARFQPSGAADGIIAAGVVGIANTPSNIAAAPDQSQAACLLQGVRNAPISGQLLLTPGCVGANAVVRVQAVVTGLERGSYGIHMMTYGDLVQGVGEFWNPVPLPSGLPCNPSHVGDFGTIESTDPATPATLEHYYPLPGEQGLGPGIGRGCALVATGTTNVLAVGVIGVANEIGAPPDTTTATPVSCLPTTPAPPTTAPIATASLATTATDDNTAPLVSSDAYGVETAAPILSPGYLTSRSLAGTSHSLPFFTAVPFAARLGCSAQPPSPLMTVRQT